MQTLKSKAIIRKTREDYNRIAAHFNSTRPYIWSEFKYFKRFIKDGQKVLDWGCGNGRLVLCFKGKKADYFGIDQSRELIKIARKNFRIAVKDGWARFFCADGGVKKFPDDYFDLVFMIASLFHLPSEEERLLILKNIYRQMKPGAKIVILVWNLESDWAKIKIQKDWKKVGPDDFLIPWKNSDRKIIVERYYHHFKRDELKDLLARAGFKTKKMEYMANGAWSDSKGGRNLIAVAIKPLTLKR